MLQSKFNADNKWLFARKSNLLTRRDRQTFDLAAGNSAVTTGNVQVENIVCANSHILNSR
jgi:hypothetical protein